MILLLNPAILSLVCDLLLARFDAFNLEQSLFYIASLIGSACWWMFLAWLVRAPHSNRNRLLAFGVATLYAINFVLVYGYRLMTGTMPNYYTFEYLFAEPYNSWTLLRDTWGWLHTLAIPTAAIFFWLGLSRWRVFISARCQRRRHTIIAAVNLLLAIVIQFVLHNNIRFVDQCFTADMTTSTSVMRNIYTRLTDPNAGRSGLSARVPMDVPPARDQHHRNVLIVLAESLRADALGVYGSSRPTTPFLDSLLADISGFVARFDNAFASATMTYVAVPTLLTGVSPLASALTLHTQPTFWEYQKALGRETFLFTSQSQEWENIKTYFTIPAIDHYFNKETSGIKSDNDLGIDDRYVVDHFVSWMEDWSTGRNFAGVLQLNQTHYPYWTPDSLRPFGTTDRRDLYDNAVRYTDDQLRRVFDALALHEVLDNTTIIITADHGEAFNEHGIFGHLNCLYREGIRVPLIWLCPGAYDPADPRIIEFNEMKRRIGSSVSALDIIPTILDMEGPWDSPAFAGIREGIAGQSLLDSIPDNRIVVTSNLTEMTRRHLGLSLVTGHWHYILNLQGERMGVEELYDWSNDPGETTNVIATIPVDLRQRIDEYLDSYPVSRRVRAKLAKK